MNSVDEFTLIAILVMLSIIKGMKQKLKMSFVSLISLDDGIIYIIFVHDCKLKFQLYLNKEFNFPKIMTDQT